jgi:hypothetical protein
MNPLVPFRVASRVGLLVFGLENAHHLPVGIPRKVATRAPLGDHTGVYTLPDGGSDAVDDDLEFGLGHVAGLRDGQHLGCHRPDALRRLEDRMVYLKTLLLALLLVSAALELGCDLIGPTLEAGVDSLQVDARVPPAAATVTASGPGRITETS